jgi:uncharacterized circularly permuted ATP-grasp superfamily protein
LTIKAFSFLHDSPLIPRKTEQFRLEEFSLNPPAPPSPCPDLPAPFENYTLAKAYDEMFDPAGRVRLAYTAIHDRLTDIPVEELRRRQTAADQAFLNQGITFTVYGREEGTERIFPYDLIPRIVTSAEWERVERGLVQRITTLNLFLHDLYHSGKVLKDGIVPPELIHSCRHFRREMSSVAIPKRTYVTVSGTDLIRTPTGEFAVLEDNLRVPSGVSYMLTNRMIMKRVFPLLFANYEIRAVDHYPQVLVNALRSLAPASADGEPTIALLTPGVYNSAYFEHTYLAQQMGISLVEGRDLVVQNDTVYMRTTAGLERIDVIYRRIDDDFIDPKVFRQDSVLGAPGLFEAYRKGRVALCNAIGTGVADDKAVYAYVPQLIKYYLDQDPILPNIETFVCWEEKHLQHTLANLETMVVKPVGESGGYGMLVAPHSTKDEIERFRRELKANPRNYIAQPTIQLSTAPCFVDGSVEPRHVDLRPYILASGPDPSDITVVPGGLTRVALRKGSLVVNSSQGGGSKDTWVLADDGLEEDIRFRAPSSSGNQSQTSSPAKEV